MKITYNTKNINGLLENARLALIDTAEAVKTDLAMKPIRTNGSFVDDKKVIKGVARIVVDTVYARKVYFDPEIHIKQGKNPNAKQYYFDDYISGNKKDLPIKYFKQMLKRRNG